MTANHSPGSCWLGTMSVRSRLQLLLFGLTALLLCSFYLWRQIWNDRAHDLALHGQVQHTIVAMQEIAQAQQALTGLRRGLITGITAALDDTAAAEKHLEQASRLFGEFSVSVTPLKGYDPEGAALLIQIGRQLTDTTRRAVGYAQLKQGDEMSKAVSRFPQVAQPGDERLRTLMLRMQAELSDILQKKDQQQRQHLLEASLAGLLLTLIVAFLALLVSGSVLKPVGKIANALDRIGRGEKLSEPPVTGSDEFGRVGVALAELSQHTAHLNELAYSDALTGLPNRARFEEELQARLKISAPFLVLFCDLDHFRTINDGYGHGFGDGFLRAAGERLQALAGAGAGVFRYSGDLFVVVAPAAEPQTYGEQLRQGMAELGEVGGRKLPLNASFGIARYPDDGPGLEELVSSADAAMYQAKRMGRNSVQIARGEHTLRARNQLELAEDLRAAIGSGQISPYFQPVLDLATGEVVCAEALARWQHPKRGFVPPDQFIAIAEDSGQIDALTDVLLREACTVAAGWMRSGSPRKLAFNLSARQVRAGVVEIISGILRDTGLPPELLEVEITEGAIIERPEHAERLLTDLRSMGVSVALDDFGTGYSSLSYLLRFPIDKIKVDKSFVQHLEGPRQANKIIAATIALAASLDMRLVAEGVEHLGQMLTLYELGCRQQQGWLFAKALPAEEFNRWIASAPLKLDAIVRAQMDAA